MSFPALGEIKLIKRPSASIRLGVGDSSVRVVMVVMKARAIGHASTAVANEQV